MRRKKAEEQKQEVLNHAGLLSILHIQDYSIVELVRLSKMQIENAKIILNYIINYMPVVDDIITSKPNHQLLLKEFTAVAFNSVLEEKFPWLANKTHDDLINKIPTRTLKSSIEGALNICSIRYHKIIKIALEQKQSGIQMETLKSMQFQVEYFQLVRSYCRHFKIDL